MSGRRHPLDDGEGSAGRASVHPEGAVAELLGADCDLTGHIGSSGRIDTEPAHVCTLHTGHQLWSTKPPWGPDRA